MPRKARKVVVTTENRGVFFGTVEEIDLSQGIVVLKDARVCVYWDEKTRGFIGLAATGPMEGSRVSAAAPRLTLLKVTSVIDCSQEAAERWEAGPWK